MQTKKIFLSILFITISLTGSVFASTNLSFEHFYYSDQLPSNSVQRIYNDKEGYMWFGTKDGLCRFDGYRIKIFRSSAINHNKLNNNNIQCIVEDNNNCLWIGTIEGINIIDKSNYSITPYDNPMIGRDRINALRVDKAGNIWVATNSRGIIRIDRNKKSHVYQHDIKLKSALPNRVSSIYEDSEGRIWAMFWKGGIALYQPTRDKFEILPPIGKTNSPFRILEDKDHNYWICTWGDGMFSMDLKNISGNPFTPVSFIKNGKPVKMSNIIYSIIQDSKMGYIWIVSFSGLNVLEKVNDHTLNLIDSESMFNEPSNKLFHEIINDRRGNLWLGSVGEGIYKLDFSKSSFQSNSLATLTKKIGFSPNVYHVCKATGNLIYLVIDRLGLYTLDLRTGILTQSKNPLFQGVQNIQAIYQVNSRHEIWIVKEESNEIYVGQEQPNGDINNVTTINIDKTNHSVINCFLEDSNGNVWIGFEQGLYKRFANGRISLISSKISNITSIAEDKNGHIWVGTEKQGVFQIQLNAKVITRIMNFSEKSGNLQSNSIQSVCCVKNGNVYIGSREGSIYLYDYQANKMTDISSQYGITEDAIQDIVEDNYGLLWISTVKKIIRYNPVNHVSTYYTPSDGILVSSFSKNAGIKLQNGQIFFGGNKGFCLFTPGEASNHHTSSSKVTITNIDVNNLSIFDHTNKSHYDSQRNKLILQPKDDNISLEFSALNYSSADKIQYAYRLIGIDKDWVYLGNNRRYVNYTNLPSGQYTFEVKATDENGQWVNRISSLTIIKKPHFYQSWWAYLLYFCLAGAIIWFLLNRVRLRNELRISRIDKEKSEELAQTKLRYFTNISHDLLTPLTIISLLIDELQSKSQVDKNQVELIKNNVNRLRRLIRQILAFRKIDTGNMKLKVKNSDIVSFIHQVCYTNFQPLINEKNISFAIETTHDSFSAYFDPDKLDKVLYNLLSNAFKFTPSGGSIIIKISFPVQEGMSFLHLSVSDTGEGIHEKDLPHIFSRFYISNSSDQSQSNGIGLSLVRDLLQIHKGEINVDSKLKEGTTFTFEIPVSEDAFTEDEFASEENDAKNVMLSAQEITPEKLEPEKTSDTSNYNILVVEDNRELNQIIVNHLENRFTVYSAYNGNQALNSVNEHPIDLIISDVMMPEMDGLELCKTLKSDITTSHIDILLLTAKISTDDQIDYFNAGADAYMPKPFDLKVLEARVNNLISKRKKNITDFRKDQQVNISAMQYSSLDEEFLQKGIAIVEQHMDDFEFDFDKFAEAMNSSKSTLHRKLKALTDLSPGEFIRNIRLKHACKMLVSNNDPISEIAYSLGFNNPKYFSSCFKTEFGMTPREYRDSAQNE
ncbi:integral membrane sensor hybrid histidine kinase [Paludibacter propionicigenes WB4]|uniref:histidine kinase n=1 Tax=Paludibacter propionicigenes (strain DSM 17365 / JCM 13257 / WB4) TaxID=694427 RepID=E4T0V7_PALPW|nr:hybrid sensor histidine kinase/response regulator transcription factor [Paludibacter propionicigenes]ADQ78232.1 integral membrane sensor hybrid histidine kinase [Paludibacter propionicigenes WB4]